MVGGKAPPEVLAAAAREALASWGWSEARLRLIKHRENAVFEASRQGEQRALRLHRQGYHGDAELHSELLWLKALAEAGLRVPEAVPDQRGNLFIRREFAGLDGPVQVDVFQWVNGQQLGSVEAGVEPGAPDVAQTWRTIGELAAQVHNQASAWTPPEGFVRHAWDENGVAGKQPIWGRFWEHPALTGEERALMERIRKRLRGDLAAVDKHPGRYSMIHADFALENIMVDGDTISLIDFDDAGFGWHLFELVTAVHFITAEDYYPAAREALIEGYRNARPFPDELLELWPLFELARATTYLGWVESRPDTETARNLTPMLIESACELAEAFLGGGPALQ